MSTFINIDIPTSAEDFAAATYADIQERWPDWEPADANLETRLIEAFSRVAQEVSILASEASEAIFRAFGENMVNVAPIVGVAASAPSTWTMKDNAGYTIEEGTEVLIKRTGTEAYTFRVVADVEVTPGNTETDPGEVILEAVDEGEDANGLSANPTLLSAFNYLDDASDAIDLTADTSGGVDEETEDEYADRLVEEFQILSPKPILPGDFAILARRHEGVHRALFVDGWNPPAGTGEERYVGGALIDEDGEDVDAGIKTAVQEDLDARREVNFIVEIGSPTYTDIFVTTVVRCYLEWEPADVDAAVTAVLEDYLDPANWGRRPEETDDSWENQTVVRFHEVAAIINAVEGVHYIESLFIDDATAPAGTADVALTGVVPLTRPATAGTGIDVTANAGP